MSHPNKKLLAAGAVMVGLSAFVPNPLLMNDAFAQATATDTMTVKASVTNPLNIKQATKIDFGTFAVAGVGDVSLTTGGAGTVTTNGFEITSGTNGSATITAPQNATFHLSVTPYTKAGPGTDEIYLVNGGAGAGATSSKTMTLDSIKVGGGSNITGHTGTLSPAAAKISTIKVTAVGGVGKIDLGGTLSFTGNQVVGAYTQTYTMRITF